MASIAKEERRTLTRPHESQEISLSETRNGRLLPIRTRNESQWGNRWYPPSPPIVVRNLIIPYPPASRRLYLPFPIPSLPLSGRDKSRKRGGSMNRALYFSVGLCLPRGRYRCARRFPAYRRKELINVFVGRAHPTPTDYPKGTLPPTRSDISSIPTS